MSTRLRDVNRGSTWCRYVGIRRLAVRIDDITHEVIKIDGNTISVTLACEPRFAVLVDSNTIVYEHGEIDVSCMSCLVKRSWL